MFFGEGGTAGTVMEKGAFYREGMVGVSLTGDIRMRSFVAQGARRVGPTFNADKVFYAMPFGAVAFNLIYLFSLQETPPLSITAPYYRLVLEK